MKFSKEFLLDEVLGNSKIIIEDKIVDTSRWSIIHELIFGHNGRYYRTYYSIGATEYQNESPFEFDPDEIECTEVVPREERVTVWVKEK